MLYYVVKELGESSYSHSDVLHLIHASFAQWEEKSIHSALLDYTIEHFKNKTNNATILIVEDSVNNLLIGTGTLYIKNDEFGRAYCFFSFLAIHPDYKGKGIASLLLKEVERIAKLYMCSYIKSDTSIHAKWSIKWHKKNGFRIVGLDSFPTNKYYSYCFRKELTAYSAWDNAVYRSIRFTMSYLRTRFLLKSDGTYTLIGRVYRTILNSLK